MIAASIAWFCVNLWSKKGGRMSAVNGIGVDAWVVVDADCESSCEIVGERVQLRFGSPCANGLTLVFSEASLEKHTSTCAEALRKLRDDHV